MTDSTNKRRDAIRARDAMARHLCASDYTDGFCQPREGRCSQQGRHRDCVASADALIRAMDAVGIDPVWNPTIETKRTDGATR